MIKRFIKKIIPYKVSSSLKNYKILSQMYGQYRSMEKWKCIDGNNDAIPWYTYPAIEYINQLNFTQKTIFEYGSGNSTIFWAKRCAKLYSVEDDSQWFDKIKPQLPGNVDCKLAENKEEYINSINSCPGKVDLIIVDGSFRYECAVQALKKLKDDGMIILDNSDWMEKSSQLLREADLIEVDMSGFGPINWYTWTTSFYFTRNVNLELGHDRQPVHGIGSLPHREK